MRFRLLATPVAVLLVSGSALGGDPLQAVRNPVLFNAASNDPAADEMPGLGINFTSSPAQSGADTVEDAFGNQDGTVEPATFIFGDSGAPDNGNAVLGDGGELVDYIEWQTSEPVDVLGYHLIISQFDPFGRQMELVRFLVDDVERDSFDNDSATGTPDVANEIERPFGQLLTGTTFRIELTRASNGPRITEIDALTESFCGNGTVEATEECDDGNTVDEDGCTNLCTAEGECGDGVIDPLEFCDDGNTVECDGCTADCLIEASCCGDGAVQPGEACDDGNTLECDGCSNQCELDACCGDGTIQPGEACDDGNTLPDDGCDLCQIPTEPLVGEIKLKVGLNFAKPQKDAISLGIKGLGLPDAFPVGGGSLSLDVGGALLDVTLDEKGRYKSSDKKDRIKLKQTKDLSWKLKMTRKKSDFAGSFADEGLVDEDNKSGKSATLGVSVGASGRTFVTDHGVTYRSKVSKKGTAKSAN
jgi:cysteine-rich repeat protein